MRPPEAMAIMATPLIISQLGATVGLTLCAAILGYQASYIRSLPYLHSEEEIKNSCANSNIRKILSSSSDKRPIVSVINMNVNIATMLFVSSIMAIFIPYYLDADFLRYIFDAIDINNQIDLSFKEHVVHILTFMLYIVVLYPFLSGRAFRPIFKNLSLQSNMPAKIFTFDEESKEIKKRVVVLSLRFLATGLLLGILGLLLTERMIEYLKI